MSATISIGQRYIGTDQLCFIIAEAGINHNGSMERARQLIKIASEAGADAIKFQTFSTHRVVTATASKAAYQKTTTGDTESQQAMLKRHELSHQAHAELFGYAAKCGIMFLSSPFDEESVDFLVNIGVLALKVGSGELTNLPFLRYMASKHLPILLSTGMSYLGEVDEAVQAIRETGNNEIVILHCVSNYPTDVKDVNLRAMHTLATCFGVPVGYSDHTPGIEVAVAAVAMGACVIEKHFTIDKSLPGPDHQASLDPKELVALVRAIRNVECALGDGVKRPAQNEADTRRVARRSLVSARDIVAGKPLTGEMIAIKRPGDGIAPRDLPHVIGRTLKVSISADTVLEWDMLA